MRGGGAGGTTPYTYLPPYSNLVTALLKSLQPTLCSQRWCFLKSRAWLPPRNLSRKFPLHRCLLQRELSDVGDLIDLILVAAGRHHHLRYQCRGHARTVGVPDRTRGSPGGEFALLIWISHCLPSPIRVFLPLPEWWFTSVWSPQSAATSHKLSQQTNVHMPGSTLFRKRPKFSAQQ